MELLYHSPKKGLFGFFRCYINFFLLFPPCAIVMAPRHLWAASSFSLPSYSAGEPELPIPSAKMGFSLSRLPLSAGDGGWIKKDQHRRLRDRRQRSLRYSYSAFLSGGRGISQAHGEKFTDSNSKVGGGKNQKANQANKQGDFSTVAGRVDFQFVHLSLSPPVRQIL